MHEDWGLSTGILCIYGGGEAQRRLKEWPERKEAVLAWRRQVRKVFQESGSDQLYHMSLRSDSDIEEIA